jgi:hypothetical protein
VHFLSDIIRSDENDLAHSADLIRKGAENYRLLIEKAPFPIVITKLSDRTILEINNEAADLFSIIPYERIGKKYQNDLSQQ